MIDDDPDYLVEPLAPHHDRKAFDCGVEALNRFLQTQARKELERRSAVTYVLVVAGDPSRIAGFYSLSSAAVPLDALPADLSQRLGKQPAVPVTLLGRLAVSTQHAGRGLGARLLWDALRRSEQASRTVGSVAVIVDAKSDSGARFYERYGFVRFAEPPRRLFITMETIARAATPPASQ